MAHHFLVHFVNAAWKDKYIKCWVPVSVPWAGSVESLLSFINGNTGIPLGLVDRNLAAKMFRSWESVAATLPVPGVVTSSDDGTDVVARIGRREFTTNNISELVQYVAGDDARDRYIAGTRHNTVSLHHPGVDVRTAVSIGIPTTSCINIPNHKYAVDLTYDDLQYTKGDGDGTVNKESLLRSRIWKSSSDKLYKEYINPDAGHTKILSSEIITDIIMDINAC